ncbi:class I SAM-dependent methyltransferase [Flavobacterium sp.]|uniref:class I SAM-dependent methyltransferase n=1 Tax=Flavobacterium sp. TaxID=239 RepID=UPI0037526098
MLPINLYSTFIHPKTKASFKEVINDKIVFNDGNELSIYKNIPILLSKDSIFSSTDVIENKVTTQDSNFRNKNNFKNYIRTKIIPSLSHDFKIDKRYYNLNLLLKENSKILILGAGDKIDYYKNIFNKSTVITSDVHTQFAIDVVLDGHEIPFKDEVFDLVLAAQVIEHTLKPWVFASEIFRVTKTNGYIQIEAPQNYPYHGQPYDFFRFTFTGLRSMFSKCKLYNAVITEGNASTIAITNANFIVNASSNRYYRQIALFITRFMFGWMKYLDNLKLTQRTVSSPKGFAMTFLKDNKERNSDELFEEFYKLPK